jgi:hypothetical protein
MKNIDRAICAAFIIGALVTSFLLFQARPRADASKVISFHIHKIPSPKSDEVPSRERTESI